MCPRCQDYHLRRLWFSDVYQAHWHWLQVLWQSLLKWYLYCTRWPIRWVGRQDSLTSCEFGVDRPSDCGCVSSQKIDNLFTQLFSFCWATGHLVHLIKQGSTTTCNSGLSCGMHLNFPNWIFLSFTRSINYNLSNLFRSFRFSFFLPLFFFFLRPILPVFFVDLFAPLFSTDPPAFFTAPF